MSEKAMDSLLCELEKPLLTSSLRRAFYEPIVLYAELKKSVEADMISLAGRCFVPPGTMELTQFGVVNFSRKASDS
jgi:hypothetical protein